jgi:uncharacterized repeat protein (TIGR03803 family)
MAHAEAPAATETVLHNFNPSAPRGQYPYAGVIRDSAGNLYGTTWAGGTGGAGVVYKLDPAIQTPGGWLETVLYSFTGGADGGYPNAGVIRDSAGNLYGTTTYGGSGEGSAGSGVVYKLDTAGQETVLYTFTGGADGSQPAAGVIRDAAGNLYGTTPYGGTGGAGVVYKLDTSGHETVLYSFTGGADGGNPGVGVIRDSAGNLYGTTGFGGGCFFCGVVYKVDPSGNETVLHRFTGGADGGVFAGPLVRDSAGNLYGTTLGGGTGGAGVVYKVDTSGNETVLYTFTGGADGANPYARVIRDSAGNLYGTTQYGGTGGAGVVYKVDTSGNETVLYSFTGGADAANPVAGVIRDEAGNLYGTTESGGGPANLGAVYKLDTSGKETVLCAFTSPPGGSNPGAAVIRDDAGNLYGTTVDGGTGNAGVVYKLDPAGQETVLYTFAGPPGTDGFEPYELIRDSTGNLYGATYNGGTAGVGVVYKLDTSGKQTVLHSFTGGADGGYPTGGLALDSAGNLYGTTSFPGLVYKVDTAGQETVLYTFTGGADGGGPNGVTRDSAGNLYGTAAGGGASNAGVIYKLDTAGHETVLYNFTGGTDGGSPSAGVIGDSQGGLYGTTYSGGTGAGVVFRLDKAGKETVLYTFTGGADGGHPPTGVIRDAAGNLYGTTPYGGSGVCYGVYAGCGVVYKLDTTGQETVLHGFTGGAMGAPPTA